MIKLPTDFRRATSEDAAQMVELVNMAGDGLPLYLWGKFARPGQSARDVGLERARNGLGGFAFDNTVVRDVDGRAAACLIGYPNDASPWPTDDIPAPLVPLLELSGLVPDTWWLNVLATYPEHRGKGYATELLRIAEMLARDCGTNSISLTVSDANSAALRLYARNGYTERARRQIVKDTWKQAGNNWLLLTEER